jgi:uncharacterized protein YxeA
MKSTAKFILYLIIIIVLAVAGILLYQSYGISEDEIYVPEPVDIEQAESADSAVNSSDLFD